MNDLNSKTVKDKLREVGVFIEDIYDLVNSKKSYPKALPILVQLLNEVSQDAVKEGIIRSLAIHEAKGLAGKPLLIEYNKISKDNTMVRWAIGNTMEVIATDEEVEEILKIVKDKSNGISRQMFVLALGKFDSKVIENTLIKLLDDQDVIIQSIDALTRLKSKKAIPALKNMLKNPKNIGYKHAVSALKKLEK